MGGVDDRTEPGRAIEEQVDAVRGSLLRPDENAVKRWVLLNGNRGAVAGASLGVVLLVFLALGTMWTTELVNLLNESEIVQTLYFTLLSGTILLVSIAVSINAVVLSEELTPLGEQEERVDETLAFRSKIRKLSDDDSSPVSPAEFLQTILRATQTQAERLADASEGADAVTRERVDRLVADIVAQVDAVEDRLAHSEFGTSDVLLSGLDYDYSWQMYVARRMLAEGDLTDEQRDALETITDALKRFTTGREYFKTLYFKSELADLSRWLLVASFPTIVYLSYALLALRAGLIPDISVLGVPSLVLFVGASYTVGLLPYALFTAYVFRSATIAKRTLAAGPFILDERDIHGSIDWTAE